MAFEKGNQLWRKRSKHGRDRIIQDPFLLWEDACEYFEWCLNNPIIKIEFKGTAQGIEEVQTPLPKVFQKPALAMFCGVGTWDVINNLREVSGDFIKVVDEIEAVIYSQKFEHAAVGMFNSSIIMSDLGMKNKSDLTSNDKEIKPTVINLGGGIKPDETTS